MAGRGGRKPKGDRGQLTLRAPKDHLEFYRLRAAEHGIPITDYLAIVLAQATGLDRPDYLPAEPQLEQPKLAIGA